jgi:DNA-binding HxlR family transcriptional regulator
MYSKEVLNNEQRAFVESRLKNTLRGIEETLQHIFELQGIDLPDLKGIIQSLEKSFNLLSQKWNLQILYTLFLRKTVRFGELKRILGVNSRTLSDKLKSLKQCGYVRRTVEQGPPIRVTYSLTTLGQDTILLALPLLYHSSGIFNEDKSDSIIKNELDT